MKHADFSIFAKDIINVFFELDKNLCFTYWSNTLELLTGIRAADAAGKSLYDLFPMARGQDREKAYLEVLKSGQSRTIINALDVQGSIRYIEMYIYPAAHGLSVFVTDITERMLAEKALQESEALFRRIFDESPVGAATVGLNYRFLRVNNAFCKFIGYSAEELRHMGFPDITVREDVLYDKERVSQILTGEIEQFEREKRYICKDGSIKWARLSVRVIRDAEGNPLYLLPIIQDINDLKEAMGQLLEARDKAEESNRKKTRFLANISHDLRTPLTGILGFSELLLEENDPERIQRMAEVINKSGDRLLESLNMILDFSKLESGATVPKIVPVDMVELADESLQLFQGAAEKKGIRLELLKCCTTLVINSDRKIVRDIVNNLVNNALKFTNTGRVTIRLDEMDRDGRKWCIIEIGDTGIGIAEENISLIFEEYRQITDGPSYLFKGTGLGLPLCKKYVELLGGAIHVQSKLNSGSVFTVSLPVK